MYKEFNIQNIALNDIDFKNIDYKLSKNKSELLEKSIKDFGVIETPVILKSNDKFVIIFGHNRLNIIRDFGEKYFELIVIEHLTPDYYIKYALLKQYRNELGPIGRLKLISIIINKFKMNSDEIIKIGKTGLGLPGNFLDTNIVRDTVLNFPPGILQYLDEKNITVKIIAKLAKFPKNGIEFINTILGRTSIRVNIFNIIIDYCSDIFQQEMGVSIPDSISIPDNCMGRELEEHIYDSVLRLRYPEFSRQKLLSDTVIEKISRKGISVEVPKYFEGDTVYFKIQANKKENSNKIKERFHSIENKYIDELLKIL